MSRLRCADKVRSRVTETSQFLAKTTNAETRNEGDKDSTAVYILKLFHKKCDFLNQLVLP